MGTNSYVTKLKAQLNQAITQRDHWKQLAENRNSIVVTEVCQESRSVEEYIIDADSVRSSWRLIREYREQIEALRQELIRERDAARTQLAAIQGGMGEDVVVLATVSMGGVEYGIAGAELGDIDIQPDMEALCALQQSLVTGEDDAYVELIDKAQHQRITAAMAAEVERLSRMLNNATNDGIKLADERDALAAENEALVRNLRGKHSLVGATYEHLIRQRDEALAKLAELAAIEGQEPVLWFRSLIGAQCKPDGRCYDVVFSPCEGFMPLYALPPASPDVEGLVNELQRIAEKCSDPDATDALDTALSTWRQAQEGKP